MVSLKRRHFIKNHFRSVDKFKFLLIGLLFFGGCSGIERTLLIFGYYQSGMGVLGYILLVYFHIIVFSITCMSLLFSMQMLKKSSCKFTSKVMPFFKWISFPVGGLFFLTMSKLLDVLSNRRNNLR